MGELRQFYGGAGVPLCVHREDEAPARAWRGHRLRLQHWLASVPDADWSGPTRCSRWDMTALVRHLVSGSQFLGYTLHKANGGLSTSLMQGFDTHRTVQADGERFGEMTPGIARDLLAAKDALVAAEIVNLRLTGPDMRIGLDVAQEVVHVTIGSASKGAAVIESNVVALVDRATGRRGGPVQGDPVALAVLDGFGELLSR